MDAHTNTQQQQQQKKKKEKTANNCKTKASPVAE